MRFAIVPAYNEEKTIQKVIYGLKKYVDTVIIVNDCSEDNTGTLSKYQGALVIDNEVNLGYENSLFKGIKFALANGADALITFDADGQHPFESIESFFSLVENKSCDIVIGNRSVLPRISEKIFSLYTNKMFGIPDILCGMKCYSARIFDKLVVDCDWDSVGSYISLKSLNNGFKVESIPIKSTAREYGFSRYGINVHAEVKIMWALLMSLKI